VAVRRQLVEIPTPAEICKPSSSKSIRSRNPQRANLELPPGFDIQVRYSSRTSKCLTDTTTIRGFAVRKFTTAKQRVIRVFREAKWPVESCGGGNSPDVPGIGTREPDYKSYPHPAGVTHFLEVSIFHMTM